MSLPTEKFQHPTTTAKGEKRASVELRSLETLWFNTGSQCNLACENCYIESSPTNDSYALITQSDVETFLNEIKELSLPTREIGFTGGEPFLNKNIIEILELTLSRGFEVLVLTNAYRLINKYKENLLQLSKDYPDKLLLRVSLDHYSQSVHETERGEGTFLKTLENIKWMCDSKIPFAIAGRALVEESLEDSKSAYGTLFEDHKISIDTYNPKYFVVFPEMRPEKEVPEITTECWGILNKSPEQMMCSSSRMLVKKKGDAQLTVLACTLLTYDSRFELGNTLAKAAKTVPLNHAYCAQFCVLGGASCS